MAGAALSVLTGNGKQVDGKTYFGFDGKRDHAERDAGQAGGRGLNTGRYTNAGRRDAACCLESRRRRHWHAGASPTIWPLDVLYGVVEMSQRTQNVVGLHASRQGARHGRCSDDGRHRRR